MSEEAFLGKLLQLVSSKFMSLKICREQSRLPPWEDKRDFPRVLCCCPALCPFILCNQSIFLPEMASGTVLHCLTCVKDGLSLLPPCSAVTADKWLHTSIRERIFRNEGYKLAGKERSGRDWWWLIVGKCKLFEVGSMARRALIFASCNLRFSCEDK